MEATRGNPSIALPVVADGKPFPGLVESCRQLRRGAGGQLPDGRPAPRPRCRTRCPSGWSRRCTAPSGTRPPSPRRPLETELNAQADNPLVSPSDGTLVSNGNFHPVLLAIAFDALRVAIAHVGQLSDRRLGHLWAAFFEAMAGGGRRSTARRRTCPACTCGTRRPPPTRNCASWRRRSASTSASSTRGWRTTPPPRRSASGRPTRRWTCWPTS